MGGSRCLVGHALISHLDIDVGDGLTLHVAESGDGPPVVLLHGFTGSSESWIALRAALDDHFRVITVDLPGHGESSSPADPSRYAVQRFIEDLDVVWEKASIGKAALIGYSMGGRMAVRFALAHPERVSSLVLESTSPGILDEVARQARIKSDAALAYTIQAAGIERFVDYWEGLSLWDSQKSLSAEKRFALRSQRLSNNSDGLANSLRGAGAGDADPVHAQLAALRMPTLIIAGFFDHTYVSHANFMTSAIASSRLEIIQDAGHAVHFEKPDVFAAVVRRFLLDSHE